MFASNISQIDQKCFYIVMFFMMRRIEICGDAKHVRKNARSTTVKDERFVDFFTS